MTQWHYVFLLQLSKQQSAWQAFAARQIEQYDQQRALVQTYCTAEVARIQAHKEHTQQMMTSHDALSQVRKCRDQVMELWSGKGLYKQFLF